MGPTGWHPTALAHLQCNANKVVYVMKQRHSSSSRELVERCAGTGKVQSSQCQFNCREHKKHRMWVV
jgi:hypothetical protein